MQSKALFLSAFEKNDVLSTELQHPFNWADSQVWKQDWSHLLGGKSAALFAEPGLPIPVSACLHPQLAAEFFERMHNRSLLQFLSDRDRFLLATELLFRELVEEHCLGEVFLPFQMQYTDAPLGWVLRSSHVLDEGNGDMENCFPLESISESSDVPKAVARLTHAYFSVNLKHLKETVPADVALFPGNFLLQPKMEFRQKGQLEITLGETRSKSRWSLEFQEPLTKNELLEPDNQLDFQGKDLKSLLRFFPAANRILSALPEDAPAGLCVTMDWGTELNTGECYVLKVNAEWRPTPGTYVLKKLPSQLQTFLGGCHSQLASSYLERLLPFATIGVRTLFPFRQRTLNLVGKVWMGRFFLHKNAQNLEQPSRFFDLVFRIASKIHDSAAGFLLQSEFRRIAQKWSHFLVENREPLAQLSLKLEEGQTRRDPHLMDETLSHFQTLLNQWGPFFFPMSAWLNFFEKRVQPLLPENHLATASESRTVMALWQPKSTDLPYGTESERVQAMQSFHINRQHALAVLMSKEISRVGQTLQKDWTRLVENLSKTLGLEKVEFLTLEECKEQLRYLNENLTAASLNALQLENKIRLRAERNTEELPERVFWIYEIDAVTPSRNEQEIHLEEEREQVRES